MKKSYHCYERSFSSQYSSFASAADAYGIYQLGINPWNVGLVLPLNETNKGHYTYSPPITITANGAPLCHAGLKMLTWGCCRERCRIKWRCPVSASKPYHSFNCPVVASCTASSYGPVVVTRPHWDIRSQTPVVRNSQLRHTLYTGKGASERRNNRKPADFSGRATQTSGRKLGFLRVRFTSMCQPIKEW